MNNVFVYCEIEQATVQEVSQELLTKGRKLANQLGVELHAIVAGTDIKGKVEDQILPYGVDKLFVFDGKGLFPYTSAPHTDILVNLFKEEQPQIALMGATVIGRDLGPRVSSSLTSGLTADCTQLEIGEYDDKKAGKHYDNILYQIRPAFGGNIVATIVNPDHRPQMATVRSGVMQKAIYEGKAKQEVVYPEVSKYVDEAAYAVKVIERHVEAAQNNLKGAPIVVAGGYGVGSKENFETLIKRVSDGLSKITDLGFENSLIVTHGITVKALQTILEKRSLSDISKLPVITGCSLIGYEIEGSNIKKFLQDDKYDFVPK